MEDDVNNDDKDDEHMDNEFDDGGLSEQLSGKDNSRDARKQINALPKLPHPVRGQFSVHFTRLQEEARIRAHNKEIDRQLCKKLIEGKAARLQAWANTKNNECDDDDNDDCEEN